MLRRISAAILLSGSMLFAAIAADGDAVFRTKLPGVIVFSGSGDGAGEGEGEPGPEQPVTTVVPDRSIPAGVAVSLSPTSAPSGIASWRSAGAAIPQGLSITTSGGLTGTPTKPGTFSGLVVEGLNSAGAVQTTSNAFTVTVTSPAITITWPASLQFPNDAVQFSIGVTGGYAPTIGVTGLPAGLSYAAGNVTQSLPTIASGSYSITVAAQDGYSSRSETRSLVITSPITVTANLSNPTFSTSAAADYTLTATAQNATGATSWTVTGLPPGMTETNGGRSITGVPTAAGQYAVTFTATDSLGVTGSVTANVTVVAPTGYPEVVSSGALVSTASTSLIVPLPDQYAQGDVILLMLEGDGLVKPTAPVGWFGIVSADGGVNGSSYTLAYRVVSGTISSPIVNYQGDHVSGKTFSIRGVDTVNGQVLQGNYANGGGATAASGTIGGVTTHGQGLFVGLVVHGQDTASPYVNWSSPDMADVTEVFDGGTTAGHGGGYSLVTARLDPAIASGPWSMQYTLNSSVYHRAFGTVFKPAH